MNIAARFPVKSCRGLLWFIFSLHTLVFFTSLVILNSLVSILIALTTVSFSFYYCYREYLQLTNAPDDLCWSGDNWSMSLSEMSPSGINSSKSSSHISVNYLELSETSWVTPFFCFLKFERQAELKIWFFTPNLLGDRLYRELCYLIRSNIKEMTKISLNPPTKSES